MAAAAITATTKSVGTGGRLKEVIGIGSQLGVIQTFWFTVPGKGKANRTLQNNQATLLCDFKHAPLYRTKPIVNAISI